MSQRRANEIAFLRIRDEEVDEMIPETDVDDTQCSEQIVDIRPLKLFTTFHYNVSRNESSHKSLTCKCKWWGRSSEFSKIKQRVENT